MNGWRTGLAVLVLLAAAAQAEETCVNPNAPGWQPVLKRGTSAEAVEKALDNEKKLRALTECGVAPGTPVKVLASGTTFVTIEVLDGQTKGCTGEFLRSTVTTCAPAPK
jgi:hypothetical protein